MNNSFKIRLLLLVLTLCFIGTAITINVTFRKEEVLRLEAKRIEQHLHKKELFVQSLLKDTKTFNALKEIHNDEELTKHVVEYLGEKKKVFVYTYSNSELSFWGADKIVPQSDAGLPEGSSLIVADNGWYEAIKRSKGGFSVVCLIPIKAKYALKNDHLNEDFSADLIHSQNLAIANYDDSPVYNIRSSDDKYLFSVKLKQQTYNSLFSKLELAMWLAAMFFVTILMNSLCVWIASKGRVKLSVGLFFSFFVLTRYVDLKTGWLANHFFNEIFDPKYYASSFIFPSLGAFLLNIIAGAWFMCYIYNYRYQLFSTKTPSLSNKTVGFIFYGLASICIYLIGTQIVHVFSGLIGNSNIQFDVTNILKLNIFSWLGILALCLVIFNLFLLLEVLFAIGSSFNINKNQWYVLFITSIVFYTLFQLIFDQPTISFFVFCIIILLRAYTFYSLHQFNLVIFITTLLLFACIASLKQTQFINDKELETQKLTLQRLESADDPDAVFIFYSIENTVAKDPYLINYFAHPERYNKHVLNDYIKQKYFSGYLSRYEFNVYELTRNYPDDVKSVQKLSYYKQKVESGSIKVSEYFYRVNNNLGSLLYFGLLPVIKDGKETGTALIELSSKAFERYASFPEILSNGRLNKQDDLEPYSFAMYRNGKLINQFGDHLFSTTDEEYPKELYQYIRLNEISGGSELMYRPNEHVLMVLSKDRQGIWVQLASLSFLFLVLLLFAIIVYAAQWLITTFKNYDFSLRNVRRSFLITQNKILYRTRIQAFVVLAVVVTLIIAGVITFFSVSNQYEHQQEINTVRRINQLASGLETSVFKNISTNSFEIERDLQEMTNSNAIDINLYNMDGVLYYTTQSKIYDLGLTSKYMNAKAWLNMSKFRRSEYFQKETIGNLEYTVAYAPIKNDQDEIIAYLSLPYFSNEKDFADRIGMLLNTLINIYALVIVALGLFAVFIANRITSPLTLVQRSLAKTSIGKNNEPISWKRNDEIGSLIKEYNNMIAALEISAHKIAQSERESAWREMAKQVAHEIKNPLTPLKLGVQLLERSWRENDPNFDQKFNRFSKSFIEQIDSLSTIASEFSNFAKMPDTQFENVDIIDIIEKVIPIYNNNAAVDITFSLSENGPLIVLGDRDQLRRSFSNLLKNAIEAKMGRGKCLIDISIEKQDTKLSIAIRDNGHGIDEGVRDRIFQPNFTTKSSGTGLGLAFVKQTIESMSGNITYKTRLGTGTTFYIIIPLKRY